METQARLVSALPGHFLVNSVVPKSSAGARSMLLYGLSVNVLPTISENICLKLTFTLLASNSPDKTKFGPSQLPVTVVNPDDRLVTTYPT